MAARKRSVSRSGRERVVSSVTKVTGSPSFTAKSIAFTERSMISSFDQSSAS